MRMILPATLVFFFRDVTYHQQERYRAFLAQFLPLENEEFDVCPVAPGFHLILRAEVSRPRYESVGPDSNPGLAGGNQPFQLDWLINGYLGKPGEGRLW